MQFDDANSNFTNRTNELLQENTSEILLDESLRDGKHFVAAMNKHAPKIDTNHDERISTEELEAYASNANTDTEGKTVALFMRRNFATIGNMATFIDAPENIRMFGTEKGRSWFHERFGGDGDFRCISEKDLAATSYIVSSKSAYESDLSRFKLAQTSTMIGNVVLGALPVAAVVAAEAVMPPAAAFLSPLLLFSLERAEKVYRSVTSGQADILQAQVESRRKMLESVGLRLD